MVYGIGGKTAVTEPEGLPPLSKNATKDDPEPVLSISCTDFLFIENNLHAILQIP